MVWDKKIKKKREENIWVIHELHLVLYLQENVYDSQIPEWLPSHWFSCHLTKADFHITDWLIGYGNFLTGLIIHNNAVYQLCELTVNLLHIVMASIHLANTNLVPTFVMQKKFSHFEPRWPLTPLNRNKPSWLTDRC